jgi:hypothetical protein
MNSSSHQVEVLARHVALDDRCRSRAMVIAVAGDAVEDRRRGRRGVMGAVDQEQVLAGAFAEQPVEARAMPSPKPRRSRLARDQLPER